MLQNMVPYKNGTYRFKNGQLMVIATQDTCDGQTRIHISVSHKERLPTWDEMKMIREKILPLNRDFVMMFPKLEDYVNIHPNCLHLFEVKPTDKINDFIDRKGCDVEV